MQSEKRFLRFDIKPKSTASQWRDCGTCLRIIPPRSEEAKLFIQSSWGINFWHLWLLPATSTAGQGDVRAPTVSEKIWEIKKCCLCVFTSVIVGGGSQSILLWSMSCSVLPVVSSKSFVDSGLTLRSQAHFEPVSMTGGSGVRGEWRERRGNTHATICESDGSGGSLSDSGNSTGGSGTT